MGSSRGLRGGGGAGSLTGQQPAARRGAGRLPSQSFRRTAQPGLPVPPGDARSKRSLFMDRKSSATSELKGAVGVTGLARPHLQNRLGDPRAGGWRPTGPRHPSVSRSVSRKTCVWGRKEGVLFFSDCLFPSLWVPHFQTALHQRRPQRVKRSFADSIPPLPPAVSPALPSRVPRAHSLPPTPCSASAYRSTLPRLRT